MGFDAGVDGAAKERILFGATSPQIFGKNVPGLNFSVRSSQMFGGWGANHDWL